MVTGKRLVAGNKLDKIKQAHLSGKLRQLPAQAPDSLRNLIETCTAFGPAARYQDWAQVKHAILACHFDITGLALTATPLATRSALDEQQTHVQSYLAISDAYLAMGFDDTALKYAEVAIEVADKIDDTALRVSSLLKLANVLSAMQQYDKALIPAQQALRLAEQRPKHGPRQGQMQGQESQEGQGPTESQAAAKLMIDCLLLLGSLYAFNNDFIQATDLLEQARQLAEQIGRDDISLLALGNLANLHAQQGNYQQAILGFENQRLALEKNKDVVNLNRCLNNLAQAYLDNHQAPKALPCFAASLQQAQIQQDYPAQCHAFKGLATASEQTGDLPAARQWLQQYGQLNLDWHDQAAQTWARSELVRLTALIEAQNLSHDLGKT